MEEAHRLLHHLIDWSDSTNQRQPEQSVVERITSSINSRDLFRTDEGSFRLEQTGESVVFDLASAHFADSGQAIPRAELNTQLRGLSSGNPTLYAETNAAVAAAATAYSNGSDIPDLIAAVQHSGASRILQTTLVGFAQSDQWQADPEAARQRLLEQLQAMGSRQGDKKDLVIAINSPEVIQARLDLYNTRMQNPETVRGIPLGWTMFDGQTGGLKGGQTMVVVADTKAGKSAFCVASATRALMLEEQAGRRCDVLVANKEMHNEWQQNRVEALMMWTHELMAPYAGTKTPRGQMALTKRIEHAKLMPHERKAYAQTLVSMGGMQNRLWMVEPNAYSTIDELSSIVARIKRDNPVKLVFIDALGNQALSRYGNLVDSDVRAQGELMRSLERMAFELDVAVVVEAQERRDTTETRHAAAHDLVARSPSEISQTTCYMLRLFKVPNDPTLVEAQMVAARFCADGWSFPLILDPGDMHVEEAPMSELRRIDAICQSSSMR